MDLILTLIDACSDRPEFGRTSLQKMAFFAAHLLGVDLGHRAHYYGPFSEFVEEDVASLVLGGLAEEEMSIIGQGVRGPVRRYRYALTQDGQERLELVRRRYPDETDKVYDLVERVMDVAGTVDQQLLSQAAKTFFVAEATGAHVSFELLQDVAEEYGWELADSQRKPVERLLEALASA